MSTAGYPTIHSSPLVKWQRVANYSLLYSVQGEKPQLKPYLLMAHLDVVPADPVGWDLDPFSATVEDGFIYARGTIDDKQSVFVRFGDLLAGVYSNSFAI